MHLSEIYKHRALPFSKLDTGNIVLTKDNEFRDELYRYYSEQFKAQNTDVSDPNQMEIEAKYLEITNRLAKSKEKIEMTNTLDIKRYKVPENRNSSKIFFDDFLAWLNRTHRVTYENVVFNIFR